MIKLFRKKDVQTNVISDDGMVQKTDAFSLIVIIVSVVMSIVLIGLGIATLVLS